MSAQNIYEVEFKFEFSTQIFFKIKVKFEFDKKIEFEFAALVLRRTKLPNKHLLYSKLLPPPKKPSSVPEPDHFENYCRGCC